jgi:signal transduction histidine kinase
MKLPFSRSRGLSFKFALAITAVVAGVAFTIGAVIVVQDWRRFHKELEERAFLLARSVAVAAPEAILRNDSWFLYQSLKKMADRNPGEIHYTQVVTAMILDTEGRVLAHLKPKDHPLGLRLTASNDEEAALLEAAKSARSAKVLEGGGVGAKGFIEAVIPLFFDEKTLGLARVRVSTYEVYLQAQRSALLVIGLTLGLVILGSILGAVISRRMVKPLTAMTNGLHAVRRGELATIAPVRVHNNDELGELAATFNEMAIELAEKKVLEEQMAVSEKLVALGRITAGVAHEVNNPLAGLLNCIDTLKKHPDDKELMERYLPLLDNGLNRIKNIVESLLVELRVEDIREVSDGSSLDDLREIIEAEINGRNVSLIWENRLDDQVRINSRQVQQVVLNLLKNAVQILPDGGTVTFRSFHDGDCVVLEVEDDGPGIPPEHRSHLFDPFFTTKPNGTGLGLWVVYRLVESMCGVIEVASEMGRGTQILVTLPDTALRT